MCLSALYWAGVKAIYYGNTKQDADSIGFGDDFIYREINTPYEYRFIPIWGMMRDEAQEAFRCWELKDDKIEY
jgi:tRNA(Arg) A34 adenosine deaminase TadA